MLRKKELCIILQLELDKPFIHGLHICSFRTYIESLTIAKAVQISKNSGRKQVILS